MNNYNDYNPEDINKANAYNELGKQIQITAGNYEDNQGNNPYAKYVAVGNQVASAENTYKQDAASINKTYKQALNDLEENTKKTYLQEQYEQAGRGLSSDAVQMQAGFRTSNAFSNTIEDILSEEQQSASYLQNMGTSALDTLRRTLVASQDTAGDLLTLTLNNLLDTAKGQGINIALLEEPLTAGVSILLSDVGRGLATEEEINDWENTIISNLDFD